MKVSFIVPIYNGQDYLTDAIDSILNQTYQDWELYLVDDKSTDNSVNIINSVSDSRAIKIFNKNNLGLYGSLNQAINSLDSQWIVILMQDDKLESNYLDEMLKLVGDFPEVNAFFATDHSIDSNANITRYGKDSSRIELIKPSVSSWLGGLQRGCFWIISGSFTNRSLFNDFPFNSNLPHCADYDWLLKVLRHQKIVFYERPLTHIRIHEKQASAVNLKTGRDIQEAYEIIKNNLFMYIDDLGSQDVMKICLKRSKLAFRRCIGALFRLNFKSAKIFFIYTAKYLALILYARHKILKFV